MDLQAALDAISPAPEHPKPPRDFSWILVAVTRTGHAYILDAAEDFYRCDLIDSDDYEECGLHLPWFPSIGERPPLPEPGLYKVTNISIDGGQLIQSPNGDDWTDTEITGDWRPHSMSVPISGEPLYARRNTGR